MTKDIVIKNSSKLTMAGLALLVTLVGSFEGFRHYAYKDPVGIPTICFGYTDGVKIGDYKTREECETLLVEELFEAEHWVNKCITAPVNDNQRAALVSFAYNVGPAGVCGSTLQRYFNARMYEDGCNQMTRWVYAKGKKLPGLVKRREAERQLCLT